MDPAARYTLRCFTAGLMKISFDFQIIELEFTLNSILESNLSRKLCILRTGAGYVVDI